ncbi:Acidic fibroblast growth factor intracellular-binding protein [Trinorchestia longiramus]|nr:Acidic fibroblast growth factor intracellular-binding protein [Trinorchestia longiramus]
MIMMPEVDAFVENFTDIDENVYDLWLRGLSVGEATAELLKTSEVQEWGTGLPLHTDLQKIVAMDTNDHYRRFSEFEKILVAPFKLADECTHQISARHQKLLIEKFYTLDDSVVREIIGKKLSGRNRKDLDDVAEKTGVMLRSCRRQFDNIKRVFKLIEEASGPLISTIESYFLLSNSLSRKYAVIVFLLLNRFETNKRRLCYLEAEDFYRCGFAMIEHWSSPQSSLPGQQVVSSKSGGEDTGIDREFLVLLRDLKCLLDREKEHKSLTLCELRRQGGCSVAEAEATFKLLSRPLCTIATQLHTPKELRDLFVDVVERIVEPVRSVGWTTSQLMAFLSAFTHGGVKLLDGVNNEAALPVSARPSRPFGQFDTTTTAAGQCDSTTTTAAGATVDGSRVVGTMPTRGFRVEAPTITQIPGFTEEISGYFVKTENKSYFYTNNGKTLVTDGNYLIDPACYTNSSCGDAIITTAVEAVTLRHIILRAIVNGRRVIWTMPTRSFRVEAPTIAQIPGFTEEMSGHFDKTENKSYFYTNNGKTLVTDGNYLIDPACYTNSSCGDAIITTAVEAVTLRHVILRE